MCTLRSGAQLGRIPDCWREALDSASPLMGDNEMSRSTAEPSHIQRLLELLLPALVLLFAGCAEYGPARRGETIHRDMLFASPAGHHLRMDLYVPKSEKPAPVVVWVFGGSWKIGSKGFHVNLRG